MDTTQCSFYKNLLFVPENTPHYAVRLEAGITPISHDILKRSLHWIEKVLKMDESRLPKLCYNRLVTLVSNPESLEKYNWCKQIDSLIIEYYRGNGRWRVGVRLKFIVKL